MSNDDSGLLDVGVLKLTESIKRYNSIDILTGASLACFCEILPNHKLSKIADAELPLLSKNSNTQKGDKKATC